MVIAACGFLILAIGSLGLPTPKEVEAAGINPDVLVSPNWLISTYLVLTLLNCCFLQWGSLLFRK